MVATRDGASQTGRRVPLPGYGPIEGLLGFAMFYVFVDRATPTIVDVVTTAVPTVSEPGVRTALAAALWFVFAVTLLDQGRRQFETIRDSLDEPGSVGIPTSGRLLGYFVLAIVGGAVAYWTFERAIAMGITLIRVVGTLDTSLFAPVEFVVMVVFFVAYGTATMGVDRFLIGGIRRVIAR